MRRVAVPMLLAIAVLASACGDRSANGSRALTVFAAASLTELFRALDPETTYSFAGSDELATQIREGAPADVFAAASPKHPQELFAEGLVEQPVVFATNRLVLVVPSDNPASIETVEDVAGDGVKLVVAAEGVPVGDYTREVLENLALTGALGNVVSEEEDVKGVVGKIALGEADAGFAYATDVKPVEDDVIAIEIPVGAQPPIEYQAAIVAGSGNAAAARAFLELLLGEEGRAALAAAGFGLP